MIRPMEIQHPKRCACPTCRAMRDARCTMKLAFLLILVAVAMLVFSCRYAVHMDTQALERDGVRLQHATGFNPHLEAR